MLNSIAINHYEEEFIMSLEIFLCALQPINKLLIINDYSIYIRLLYGTSKITLRNNKIYDPTDYCEKGIELCKELESFYLLGELYYQKARCLNRFKDKFPLGESI